MKNNVLIIIVILIIAALGFLAFKSLPETQVNVLASYVLLLTLIAIIWYSLETRRLRQLSELQTRPYVFISLQPLETSPAFLNLVVQNIGASPAYDLKFVVNENVLLPSGKPISEVNFIKNGLKYLPPNHKIQFLFFNLYGTKSENIVPYEISVTYRKPGSKPQSETFTIDPAEYSGRVWVNEKRYEGIEDMLKKIHDDISGVISSSPNPKVRVVTFTKEEMKEEFDAILARFHAKDQSKQEPVDQEKK